MGTQQIRVSRPIQGWLYTGKQTVTVVEGKEIILTVPVTSEQYTRWQTQIEQIAARVTASSGGLAENDTRLTSLRNEMQSSESGSVGLVDRIDSLASKARTGLVSTGQGDICRRHPTPEQEAGALRAQTVASVLQQGFPPRRLGPRLQRRPGHDVQGDWGMHPRLRGSHGQ
jgi:hypothetical protein